MRKSILIISIIAVMASLTGCEIKMVSPDDKPAEAVSTKVPDQAKKPGLTTTLPNIAPGTLPDSIEGPLSQSLNGKSFEYIYESGRHYTLQFYDDRATFHRLDDGSAPETLLYIARDWSKSVYLVQLKSAGRVGVTTLLIDLKQDKIATSGLAPGKVIQFDVAEIKKTDGF